MSGVHTAEILDFVAARFTAQSRFNEWCPKLLECLRQHQAEWGKNARTFTKTRLHNWASHGADAWRYFATAWREPQDIEREKSLLRQPVIR